MKGPSAQQALAAPDTSVVGPLHFDPAATTQRVHGVTIGQGNIVQAGRDATLIHYHYHDSQTNVNLDIVAALEHVLNLRVIHLDTLSKATPGTVVWFLKTDKFMLWVDVSGDLKILWGTGIPGAGKTIMASIVIKDLENRAEADGSICVAYVYFRYSDATKLTLRGVLEILLKQTVERHPDCALLAGQIYARHFREKTQPTEAELIQLLHQFTQIKSVTFYILDALDEAPEKLQVVLIRKLASLNVRLFITSRPLKLVEARFHDVHSFRIIAQDGDLDLHISQEIENSHGLQGLLYEAETGFKEEMVASIKRKCGGMFLHASLQLEAVGWCNSTQEVTDTLAGFPAEIEDVYRQTWQRICSQTANNASLAKAVLLWVVNASRSMTMEELRHAIATSPDTHKFELKRMVPQATLITACCGLITIEEKTKLIRLVHYTAKETLQGLLFETFPDPHYLLATVCMTHLIECKFQDTTIGSKDELSSTLEADPLLAYAFDAWAEHARESLDVAHAEQQVAGFIAGIRAFPLFISTEESDYFDVLSPLHIVAFYNLPPNLIKLNDISDPNIATRSEQATPLLLASWGGNVPIVQELLRLEAIQANTTDKGSHSALMLAACRGHEVIVTLLLARQDIQINLVDTAGWSALMMAACRGHERVVALLLTRPQILVHLVNSEGVSALVSAVIGGHEGTVRLLLQHPEIQINLRAGSDGRSALIVAAFHGRERIVDLLLQRPEIHVNLTNSNMQSALILASHHGQSHEGSVKLLLAHPEVEVNKVDYLGCTALMRAAGEGHAGTVALLLGHPEVLINLADHEGWTALMKAAGRGDQDTVNLLLSHPDIQINSTDNEGRSALIIAVGRHEGVVASILSHPDARIDLVNRKRESAYMLAAYFGQEGSLKLFLQRPEIQLNSVNVGGWSALMMAASEGNEGIVKLLLERSEVNVNLADNKGGSALLKAADHGYLGIVKLLLARPDVLVNSADNEGHSALMFSAYNGHEDIVQLLLGHPDIQVNSISSKGKSALMLSAFQGHDSIVKLFLAHPEIQINLVDNEGYSALMLAMNQSKLNVMKLLLARHEILLTRGTCLVQ